MDVVSDMYSDAIKEETKTIVVDRVKRLNGDTEVTIYVNKESSCIEGLIML
jgi:hypothetical protein